MVRKIKTKIAAFGGILLQETSIALGMQLNGAEAHSTVLVAGGLAVVSVEVAVRLFGWGKGDGGSGGISIPRIATA